ncbi:MAG TPA: hypothetical protein VKX45_06980 [Bryobacteraceae bacterium]|jgi:hypothetical protein|nr:hypothetical protein [Bryobacteraceae bacterium]
MRKVPAAICNNGVPGSMYLFHLFRSFLPLHNPIGFGAADFVLFAFAVLLAAGVIARAWLAPAAQRLAQRPVWCMAFLFGLVVVLRLALLPLHPVPTPSGADDFSYLLLGDTLAHFRLANPVHPLHRFFETTFVIQEPSYSSIYALGQGFALALGQLAFGEPWAGVLISMGLLAALAYWMLQGWTPPGWALTGGLLAVCEFGPLNRWMNNYWGGAVSAIAGCLAFGALPRLRTGRRRWAYGIALGAGLGLQMLTRPYESLFLDLSVLLYFVPQLRRRAEWPRLLRLALPVAVALVPAVALQLAQDQAVTGSWTTLPYALSRYQYGVPTTFTFEPNATPHRALTQAQQLYYEGQAYVHGPIDTPGRYFERLASRAGFYRFFFLTPLLLALPFFFAGRWGYEDGWLLVTIALFAFGANFYPYFFPHYLAALTPLFLLLSVRSLQRLSESRWSGGQAAARWLVILCGAHFAFWFFIHAQADESMLRATAAFETADGINYGDPEGRVAVNRKLAQAPGRHLVFVRYFSTHNYHEWIHNAADIDGARVIWALDLGPGENEELKRRYPDRTVWLMEPDAIPPRLAPYPKSHGIFEDVQ